MKEAKFEREIKLLIFYIREYGIQHVKISFEEARKNPEKFEDFIGRVHEGFAIAQEGVIRNLTIILNEKKANKVAIKAANIERNKERKAELKEKEQRLLYQENAFRKIIDSLAWQFLGTDLSSVRRLYVGHTPIDITDSNLESCVKAAQDFQAQSPMRFALINDLSSFVQIGDLTLIRYGEGISFCELKEGKVNDKVVEIFDSFQQNACERYLQLSLQQEGPKFQEQFFRFAKQMSVGTNVVQVLKSGSGIDPMTGKKISIIQDEIELDCYDGKVCDLLSKCRINGYAFAVIEECLLIGVYDRRRFSSKVFDLWAKSVGIKTPIFDLRQSLFDPVGYPIYLQPFTTNEIVDIILGKIEIKMTIDIDSWLKPLEKQGCSFRWLSKKETTRITQQAGAKTTPITVDGKAVKITKNNLSQILYWGLFCRMFYMFNTPSSMLKYIVEFFKQDEQHEGI